VLTSGQKITLDILDTITFEVVPFGAYAPFPALLSFLNASRTLRDVRLFSAADSHVVFGQKVPGEKGSVRRPVVVMQQPVLSSPKLVAKSSQIFAQSP
jgi:hypothetical protein